MPAVAELIDMTKIHVVLFVVIFLLNLLPAFAPPTWTAMSFIGLTIPGIDFISLAVVAAAAATFGITLAKLSRAIVRQRLLSQQTRCNVDAIKHGIERRPVTTFGTFLAYAFSPLPSNYLFIAYGLTSLPITFLALPFFVGRLGIGRSRHGRHGKTGTQGLAASSKFKLRHYPTGSGASA